MKKAISLFAAAVVLMAAGCFAYPKIPVLYDDLVADTYFWCWLMGLATAGWMLHKIADKFELSTCARLTWILCTAFILRVFLSIWYPLWGGSDAEDYVNRIAINFLEHGFNGLDGFRVNGLSMLYSLSYVLFGVTPLIPGCPTTIMQCPGPLLFNFTASVIICWSMFQVVRKLTSSPNWGLAAAYTFAFFPKSLILSRCLLSEEICLAMLLSTACLYLKYRDANRLRYYFSAFLIGFLSLHVRYAGLPFIGMLFIFDILTTTPILQASFGGKKNPLRYCTALNFKKLGITVFIGCMVILPYHLWLKYDQNMPGIMAYSEKGMFLLGNNPYADATGRFDMQVKNYIEKEAADRGYDITSQRDKMIFYDLLGKENFLNAGLDRHMELASLRFQNMVTRKSWYRGFEFERTTNHRFKLLVLSLFCLMTLPALWTMRGKQTQSAPYLTLFSASALALFLPPMLSIGGPRYLYLTYSFALLTLFLSGHALWKFSFFGRLKPWVVPTAVPIIIFCWMFILVDTDVNQYRVSGINPTFGKTKRFSQLSQSFRPGRSDYAKLDFQVNRIGSDYSRPGRIEILEDQDGEPSEKVVVSVSMKPEWWRTINRKKARDIRTIDFPVRLVTGQKYWLRFRAEGSPASPDDFINLAGSGKNPWAKESFMYYDGSDKKWWEPGKNNELFFKLY